MRNNDRPLFSHKYKSHVNLVQTQTKNKCHSGEVVCLLTLQLFTPSDVKLRA